MSSHTGRDAPKALPAVIAALDRVFEERALHEVLAFLNARTRHRYTSVHEFGADSDRTIGLFDREHPHEQFFLGETPDWRVAACRKFSVLPAPPRHPHLARPGALPGEDSPPPMELERAALPLRTRAGGAWGSLCHTDPRPRLFAAAELPVLKYAALRLESSLVEHRAEMPAAPGITPFVFTAKTPTVLATALELYATHFALAYRVEQARLRYESLVRTTNVVQRTSEAIRAASAGARQERAAVCTAVSECATFLRRGAAPPQHMVIAIKTMVFRGTALPEDAGGDSFRDELWSDALRWGIDAYYAA